MIGSASDSTYFLGGQAAATDIFNFNNNKQLNQYVRPLALTITFTYTTPKFGRVEPRNESRVSGGA